MSFRVSCPACGVRLKAREEHIGKTARCPKCKGKVLIKAPEMPKTGQAADVKRWEVDASETENTEEAKKQAMQKMDSVADKKLKDRMPTVLLVDDEADLHTVLEALLIPKGVEVAHAYNGKQGLKMAKKLLPGCIVMDGEMPKLNGFEACARLKGDPKFEYLPIIMLTGLPSRSSKSEKYWEKKSAANYFMSKPFDYAKLTDLIITTMKENVRRPGDGHAKFSLR